VDKGKAYSEQMVTITNNNKILDFLEGTCKIIITKALVCLEIIIPIITNKDLVYSKIVTLNKLKARVKAKAYLEVWITITTNNNQAKFLNLINPLPITIYNKDYLVAWTTLIATIIMRYNKVEWDKTNEINMSYLTL